MNGVRFRVESGNLTEVDCRRNRGHAIVRAPVSGMCGYGG